MFFFSCFSHLFRATLQNLIKRERELYQLVEWAKVESCWQKAIRCNLQWSAVAFANCHLLKSGFTAHPCDKSMSVHACTNNMDERAFDTYTKFYLQAVQMCNFLKMEIWNKKTENVNRRLLHTANDAVKKLEEAEQQRKLMEERQIERLKKIVEQEEEIESALRQIYNDYFIKDFISIKETVALMSVTVIVIFFLPHFGYSRPCLVLVFLGEQGVDSDPSNNRPHSKFKLCISCMYAHTIRLATTYCSLLTVTYQAFYRWIRMCRYSAITTGCVVYL